MRTNEFFSLLKNSMTLMQTESPNQYAALADKLSGLRARLTSEGLDRQAWFENARFVLGETPGSADVHAVFSDSAILDLIDGELTLDEAILHDALFIRGTVDVVERFYEAILVYMDGAIRSPGFPELLDRYREQKAH